MKGAWDYLACLCLVSLLIALLLPSFPDCGCEGKEARAANLIAEVEGGGQIV